MKTFLTIFLHVLCLASFGQNAKFAGDWAGHLDVGAPLRLVFHISDSAGLSATMDSPDQGVYGIPCDEVTVKGDSVYIFLKVINGTFSGRYGVQMDTSILTGSWKQGPMSLPLNLRKVSKESLKAVRPQHPKPPFPYAVEEVEYFSEDRKVKLAATLTLPQGVEKAPAVILITGSGQQDRDETVFEHKPFLVIADYLTPHGYAVLRVDDRGAGKSTGDVLNATSLDFAGDVITSMRFLKARTDIDAGRIGLLGHSEGGIIAPLVAAANAQVAFMILLAAPAVPGSAVLEEQSAAIMLASGVSHEATNEMGKLSGRMYAAVAHAKTPEKARTKSVSIMKKWYPKASPMARSVIGVSTEAEAVSYAEQSILQMYNPWIRYFLKHDPAPVLRKTTCPVLALFGEKDLQVLPAQNKEPMRKALAAARNSGRYDVVEVPGVNHLFQHCMTCTIDEYGRLTETFAPEVLDMIINWLDRVK